MCNYIEKSGPVGSVKTNGTTCPPSNNPPNVVELVLFSAESIPDIKDAILYRLPVKDFCILLATCKNLQKFYLLLLTDPEKQMADTKCTIQEVFNRDPNKRKRDWILHGPGGERLFAAHKGITVSPVTFQRLRDRTISVKEIQQREQNPGERWTDLHNQLLQLKEAQYLSGINRLNKYMTENVAESKLGPLARKYILEDFESPLLASMITMKVWYANLSFSGFEQFLALFQFCTEMDSDPHLVADLFVLFCRPELREDLIEIMANPFIKNAFDHNELQLRTLTKPSTEDECYEYELLCELLRHDVVKMYLARGDLRVKNFVPLLTTRKWDKAAIEIWLHILGYQSLRAHFINDETVYGQLICLLHSQDDFCMPLLGLKFALNNPIIQQHLNTKSVQRNVLCWQQLFDLACWQGSWFRYLKTSLPNTVISQLPATERDTLSCCSPVTKLSMSMTIKAIQKYTNEEGHVAKFSLTDLIESIKDEEQGQDDSSLVSNVFNALFRLDSSNGVPKYDDIDQLLDSPRRTVFFNCRVTPFHYAKIALAFIHSDVRSAFETGTLNLTDFKQRLKGDPFSGLRLALFGLSGPRDEQYQRRVESEFLRAFSSYFIQQLFLGYHLTMDQFISIILEERKISTVNFELASLEENSDASEDTDLSLWQMLEKHCTDIQAGDISANDLMDFSFAQTLNDICQNPGIFDFLYANEKLTFKHIVTMIREGRRVWYQDIEYPMWDIVILLRPSIEEELVSVDTLMQKSDDDIRELCDALLKMS